MGVTSDAGRLSASVDFRAARRQIEEASEFPASTRRSAFAAYVALFDLADAQGRVQMPSAAVAEALATTRVSWGHFRRVLQVAALLTVGERSGGQPLAMQLHAPRVK